MAALLPPAPLWKGSPNKTKGRGGYRPAAVVVHIMEGTLRGTDAWFANPASRVSAHYGVGRAGEVHQYVLDADTAWHAGRVYKPTWSGVRKGVSPNLYTLGVEHEGRDGDVWPEPMLATSAALIAELCRRWSIPVDRAHVVGHREIYARKTCPGRVVDLDALVARTRRLAVAEPSSVVSWRGRVEARVDVNVRSAPTSQAGRVRRDPSGTVFEVTGWTGAGESVSGNAYWYRLAGGGWVWAGGTLTPSPPG